MKKFLSILLIVVGCQVLAQDSTKTKYTLFNPVPKTLMREMETDRPDITESAYSVDAGHFQLETDLFKRTTIKDGIFKDVENAFNVANLKLGLTRTIDLQLVVESYLSTSTTLGTNKITNSGFGDLTLRLKKNLWGNDSGKSALAIMPYVTIPTSQLSDSKDYEGGVIFPFALDLGNDWGLGSQVQIDYLKNTASTGYHTGYLASAALGLPINKFTDFFVESYIYHDREIKETETFINGGIIFSLSKNFRLDAGFNYGLEKQSQKVYFIGLSCRY